ncbi:MAG: anthranilate phosphoribosyltransferase [Planctomycetia bacterium]|nr:anthranilate phosphoribosyltransferase [Planctomycetia bacterium]
MIEITLGRLVAGEDLSFDEMTACLGGVMRGEWTEGQIGLLLTALADKGETVDEIAGAALALRRSLTPIRSSRADLLDTCGTGGDASGTFNISTATAIVAAASGVPIAKHGNRSITSRTGSADVLKALGVNIEASVPTVERCLDELGLCFCFAPLLHPAMRHVANVRRQLGRPTIFNVLGPLTNPASAPYQLLGVGKAALHEKLAAALARLGTRRAAVVHGEDGLDEVTLSGKTQVFVVENESLHPLVWQPEDFGLATIDRSALLVSGPEESAAMIRGILAGQPGPPRDIVLANAAAALWVVGKVTDVREGVRIAADAIDSNRAAKLLAQLAEFSSA